MTREFTKKLTLKTVSLWLTVYILYRRSKRHGNISYYYCKLAFPSSENVVYQMWPNGAIRWIFYVNEKLSTWFQSVYQMQSFLTAINVLANRHTNNAMSLPYISCYSKIKSHIKKKNLPMIQMNPFLIYPKAVHM